MAKIGLLYILGVVLLASETSIELELQQKCLACHKSQHIPSEMIYRRYLLKYSAKKTIQDRMITYLAHPTVRSSIMPPQFFTKFPAKQPLTLKKRELEYLVNAYISHFDISQRIKIIPRKKEHHTPQKTFK